MKQKENTDSNKHIATISPEYVKELEAQSKEVIQKLNSLKLENAKLRLLLQENGIAEDGLNSISDVEAICIDQLKKLKEVSLAGRLTETDAKILDVLYKNLRLARGLTVEKNNDKKTKKASTDELFKIIGN